MPFKANRDRRHHIPKQRHRVSNWAAYDAGLRARGSLTVLYRRAYVLTHGPGGPGCAQSTLVCLTGR